MAEYFKASGYRTGLFGKWHLGANYPYRPIDRGFDEWIGLGNNGLATSQDHWDNDRMNDTYWHNGVAVKRLGFCADVYFDEAMAFMKESKADGKPFFAYLATNIPHWDWNVPAEWLQPYLDTCSRERAAFYAQISRLDWNVGRLMAFLDEEGLAHNTILVFLTDNGSDVPDKGDNAYTAGMRGFKGARYDGGHRVPCFFRAPKSVMGEPRVIDELTAHLDLLPTFIDYCGLTNPDKELLPMDGRSLRPLLEGDGEWPDRMIVLHQHNGKKLTKNFRAVTITSEWRLVNESPGNIALYRIHEDRGQKNDVAAQYPKVVESLIAKYDAHWQTLDTSDIKERPVVARGQTIRLTNDITNAENPITQQAVRLGEPIKPFWLLELPEAGKYHFEVRRWPRGVDAAMTDGIGPTTDPEIEYIGHRRYRIDVPGKALDITKVELKLSNHDDVTKKIDLDARSVQFELELPAGPVDIEAWLIGPDGKRQGAYFVYVEQL
jgi:arylsulfatase B